MEDVKLSVLTDKIILYVENAKEYFKKLLELICYFHKLTGYKVNIQN